MADLQKSQFSAAQSQLGVFYQYEYALLLVLRALPEEPAIQVRIEGDDDITISDARSATAAIQTKRRGGSRKNLTDASGDVWGTLRVWVDGVQRGVFDPAVIQFLLVSTSRAPDGSVAALLRPGRDRDPGAALPRLELVAQRSGSKENAAAYAEFLALEPALRRALVNSVNVLDQSPDLDDLDREMLRAIGFASPREQRGSFLRDLKGRWLARVRRHLAGPHEDVIDGLEVQQWIDDLREQYKRSGLPTSLERAQPPEEFFRSAAKQTFVRQLGLIDLSPDQIRYAIHDYYRASEQRSRWIRDQLLHLEETDDYLDRLHEEWEREFAAMERRLRLTDDPGEMIEAGIEFYNQMQRLDIRIRDDCAARYIMRGSLHQLADEPCIGWHMRWKENFPPSHRPARTE